MNLRGGTQHTTTEQKFKEKNRYLLSYIVKLRQINQYREHRSEIQQKPENLQKFLCNNFSDNFFSAAKQGEFN